MCAAQPWEALYKLMKICIEPAKRGDSIKPGVERSATPGIVGYERRAHEVGDSHSSRINCTVSAVARFARLVVLDFRILGFRFAPAQALCLHPLRGF